MKLCFLSLQILRCWNKKHQIKVCLTHVFTDFPTSQIWYRCSNVPTLKIFQEIVDIWIFLFTLYFEKIFLKSPDQRHKPFWRSTHGDWEPWLGCRRCYGQGAPEGALFPPPRPVHCPYWPETLIISWGETAQQIKCMSSVWQQRFAQDQINIPKDLRAGKQYFMVPLPHSDM